MKTIASKYLLLCEGMHDAECFGCLASVRGFQGIPAVSCGFIAGAPSGRDGIDNLTPALNALSSIPGFAHLEAILIAADNDGDPAAAFAKVQQLVAATSDISPGRRYGVPVAPLSKIGNNPALVVMMIPWTGVRGALDTLCLAAAAHQRPALATAVNAFALAANVDDAHNWPVTKQHKMKLRSLIAAANMKDPYLSPAWVWREKTDLVPLSGSVVFDQITEFLRDFPAFLAAP